MESPYGQLYIQQLEYVIMGGIVHPEYLYGLLVGLGLVIVR
jgi:hypothetical protein